MHAESPFGAAGDAPAIIAADTPIRLLYSADLALINTRVRLIREDEFIGAGRSPAPTRHPPAGPSGLSPLTSRIINVISS